jgi:hypothetical protein
MYISPAKAGRRSFSKLRPVSFSISPKPSSMSTPNSLAPTDSTIAFTICPASLIARTPMAPEGKRPALE